MLAELAAFNAAYATVKATVKAGAEIASCAQSIGTMVQSKDDLHKKLQKRKNSPFSRQVETDLEEFLALEDIKQAEKDLELLMVYQGRVGLKDDWLKYQAQARKSRKEAERVAQQQREQLLETIGYIAAGLIAFSGVIAAIYGLGFYMEKW
jgi:molecular chaperone GrpE (heat shock protein)